MLNIISCYIGTNKQKKKLQVLTLHGYVVYFLTALYFDISTQIFFNLFICFVFDGLLLSIRFWMFCSKHSITFDTYLLSCRFHCVDIFYISFRSCETFTITNSPAIPLLTEALSNLSYSCKCMFQVSANSNVFSIYCLVFLRFTFRWYLHSSN